MRNKPKHGMKKTRVYRIWSGMIHRCKHAIGNYGRMGISVCSRWMDFRNFLDDMGHPPSQSHSIDRINNSGDYEPGNCRWATRCQQARNTSTNTVLEYDGAAMTIAEWSEKTGLKPATICVRIYKLGWSISKALSTPVAQRLPEPHPWMKVGMSRSSWYRAGRPGL